MEPLINYDILLHNFKVKSTCEEENILKISKELINTMDKNNICVKCAFGIFPCEKERDSVIVKDENKNFTLEFIRDKYNNQLLSLSDFFSKEDYIGGFVVSVNSSLAPKDDEFLVLLEKVLLTRIVEAGAEYLQRYISENIWNINIRPAIGYSSLPNHSMKENIFKLVDGEKTGAKLTDSFAMVPLSSVCGIYISNPKSFYVNHSTL